MGKVRYFILITLIMGLGASIVYGAEVELTVQGLEGDELQNVRAALAVPPGLVKKGRIDEVWLDHFLGQVPRRVGEALEPLGYYAGTATVSRETTPGGNVRLLVAVVKGEPVLVRNVTVRIEGPGMAEEEVGQAVKSFPLAQGAVLRHDVYEEAKRRLHDAAVRRGYLDGGFLVQEVRVDLAARAADIEIRYATGPRYYFGAIRFSGAPLYPRPFLERYLAFREGEVFAYEKIAQTQRNLTLADRFADVRIETDKEQARDNRVPVEIKLTPGPEKQLKIGVGYGTDTGPRASLAYRDKNIIDAGHYWEGAVNVSKVLQGLALGYTIPGRDIRTFSSLGVNLKRDNPDTYDTREFSMELQHVRPYIFDKSGAVFLQLLREDSTAGDTQTNTFSLMPGFRIFDRWFDDPTRPGKGYAYLAEIRGAHQSLGSYTGFLQGTFTANAIYALGGGFSLLSRVKIGATAQNEDSRSLPIAIRYFAGGDNSVRGYAYQSLGARDDRGEVVGGRHTLTGSVEMEKSLGKDWAVAAFYDWGNAFNSFREMDLAQGAGLGIRYYTAVGPIKLDLARQIGTPEPVFRLHLGFGFTL
ncbi:MAG TPA: autotransporter assembly complex family protein [Syntrophales bacterium]|nr:autotransporter assembly complex family protein [Syntrophales bacterium]HQG34434.1 autotransporter assembly complex family protein [Syntrophales bacterium]HQJ30080.1 autotransporter assembly complex family protein [Syntrophales bacterium]